MLVQQRQERYINPYTDFGFKKLFKQADIVCFIHKGRMEYEDSIKMYGGLKNSMDTSVAKGKADEKLAIARRMKAKCYPIEDIAEITQLPQKIHKIYNPLYPEITNL